MDLWSILLFGLVGWWAWMLLSELFSPDRPDSSSDRSREPSAAREMDGDEGDDEWEAWDDDDDLGRWGRRGRNNPDDHAAFGWRGRYFVPFAGPGFFGAGAIASMSPTIQVESRRVSVTPAAIAGAIRSVLCTRQKL